MRTLSSLVRTRLPTSRSVTHPRIDLGQARLTLEFFSNELPEKKLQLIDMGILSILLRHVPGSHIHPPFRRSMPSSIKHTPETFPLGTRLCVQCRHMCHAVSTLGHTHHAPHVPPLTRTHPFNREVGSDTTL